MKKLNLKIAATGETAALFTTTREIVDPHTTDFVDVAAVVITDADKDVVSKVEDTKFGIPIFVFTEDASKINEEMMRKIYHILDLHDKYQIHLYDNEIETAAGNYEDNILPPFFKTLKAYGERGNIQFDCPGHQGGQYFRKDPAGYQFYKFYGENLFRTDINNADVDLGDLLIHDGPAVAAEKNAARVFNADKTYFVMGGSSTSNNVCVSACVSPDDLVLFDRNNHRSVYTQTLVLSGGRPVYMQDSRDPYGFIGGVYDSDYDEKLLRKLAAEVDPKKAKQKRPFRLAVVQLGTYDGIIANAHRIIKKIGHLCDYILFDSAWVGYEQFIPFMRDCSPLTIDDLGPEDPGILVVQSTHKQQAGFSQCSQIHKKDSHIKGQDRYINHKRFNNAFLKYNSTSPNYPMFASLDINARMQGAASGPRLWRDLLCITVEARKKLLRHATMIRPFVPPVVDGQKWEDIDTDKLISNKKYWMFDPKQKWHGFDGYAEDQYFVDPNKIMMTTPGINMETGEYTNFGIPAGVLANYLREHGLIPEKNDLNSILFMVTPAETEAKLSNLVSLILNFERLVNEDVPMSVILPRLYRQNEDRYKGYSIRQLCQELHDFYKERNAKLYQKQLFLRDFFPKVTCKGCEADTEMKRNHVQLIKLSEAEGHTAVEGALPYPPGIFCIAPGEKWSSSAVKYFKILEEGINKFPGFKPEIQGVYFQTADYSDGIEAYCEVLDDEAEARYAEKSGK